MKYYLLIISVLALFLMGCAGTGVQSVPTGDWGISSQDNKEVISLPVLTVDSDIAKEQGEVKRTDVAKHSRFILAKRKKMLTRRKPINIENIEIKIQAAIDSGDITEHQAEEKRAAVARISAILDKKGGLKPMEHVKGGHKPMEHVKGRHKPMKHVKGGHKPMEKAESWLKQ